MNKIICQPPILQCPLAKSGGEKSRGEKSRGKVIGMILRSFLLSKSIGLLLFINSLFVIPAFAQSSSFSNLIIFGDSISDTGNAAFIDLPFPFFENRISNGPIAVDLIANALNLSSERSGHLLGNIEGFNYAVVGGNIEGSDPEDMNQQVDAYLDRVDQQAESDALYVLIMGGNDLRDIRGITNPSQATQRISSAVIELERQIERLVAAGARAFFVTNVPNVGRIPETLERVSTDPDIVSRAEGYVREYNVVFEQAMTSFRQRSDLSFVTFDFFAAFENVLDNGLSLGFSNTTEGCFDIDGPTIELECIILGFESRVFFDSVHPSSAASLIVGNQMIAALPPFPLPEQPIAPPLGTSIIVPIIQLLLD